MRHRLQSFVRAFAGLALVTVAGCNASEAPQQPAAPGTASVASASPSSSPPPAPSATSAATTTPSTTSSTRGAIVRGLRAEIVPVIGGLFPSSPVDPQGKPVSVPWVLRITNTTDAPIVFRTGGDDEGFEITATGNGVGRAAVKDPCNELWKFGKKNVIAAKGSLDVPVQKLVSGIRCKQTALYLTTPTLFSVDITLIGHIHDADAPPARGERGTEVRLEAPTINIKAG